MILANVSAEYALAQMIPVICDKLYELNNSTSNELKNGMKTAYVECLEIIQMWEKSKQFGLDFHIETMFPI